MAAEKSTDVRQFLVFKIGDQEYGVDIQRVVTIIEKNMNIARIPKTPDFIKGVINLRGEIIPVMNIRKRFRLPEIEDTEETRIIVLKTDEIVIGIIVDAVAEVVRLTNDAIENITNYTNDVMMDYIYGVGKMNDKIVTILNIEKLIDINVA
ncbi:MAG TPA: chemotaxis protein CheW [Clostridiaceae bacterium]|nr:chemotaxis protein CheW [Clostridiaceae bacterium]HHV99063.1 chemotaxis protein CheW [Clostridiaceae bacterium]